MKNCSVLILTRNEEINLQECLDTVKWSDDIVVYDSYSTDKTEEIAISNGCRFIRREGQDLSKIFGGDESVHRNWGLENIKYYNEWVFILDADERVEQKFIDKINAIPEKLELSHNCFFVIRKDYFLGKYLRNIQSLKFYPRLIKPKFCKYQRLINPVLKVKGNSKILDLFIDHYPLSKGLNHWISKHNDYSDLEAKQIIKELNTSYKEILSGIFAATKTKRRFYYKIFYYKFILFRPFIRFFLFYILKRGFLDGRVGLYYAILMMIYEYFISIKIKEYKIKLKN